ncbi:MAG: Txe/YoeB family addiction module toxin [Prevotellaceae bacterium]|jgi:toxin YoeB|nr:Txe/YoeB family addiction module toxin [Prevotellaceae bacterium]
MYNIEFSPNALKDIAKLQKSEPACFKKLVKLFEELREHPYTGTGHPEQMKWTSVPTWSRRISPKHRLVYEVREEHIRVFILSSYGHYDDK